MTKNKSNEGPLDHCMTREQAPSKDLSELIASLETADPSDTPALCRDLMREAAYALEKLTAPEPPAAQTCDDSLRATECPTCHGVGVTSDDIEVDCSTCDGEGSIVRPAPPPVPAPLRDLSADFYNLKWRLRDISDRNYLDCVNRIEREVARLSPTKAGE